MNMQRYCAGSVVILLLACGPTTTQHRNAISRQTSTQDVTREDQNSETSEDIPAAGTSETSQPNPESIANGQNPAGSKPAITQPSMMIDTNFVSSFLDQIAGDNAAGRLTGSPQNKMVADMIAKAFADAGLQPGGDNQTFFQAFTANSNATGSVQTQNVIGVLPGKGNTQEVIIVGAHMDHLGVRNAQTYYGADDNASGTTALVAAAKAVAKVKDQLQRTVVFIAFSAEELGLLGSQYYVKTPTFPLSQIKFMINMDMVGYSNGNLDAIGFAKTIESDRIVKDLISKTGLTPKYYATSSGGSDHMPFEQVNIPTGVFHTGLHNNYHQPTDTLEKIDRTNLGKIAGLTADLAWSLARTQAIMLRPIELEPAQYYEFAAPLHSEGCSPAFVSFEDLERQRS